MVASHSTSSSPKGGLRPKYQVVMDLGVGGMAVVRLAMTRGPEGFVKLFVLKSLKRELLADPNSRRMFLEEARISARLAHPNIVQVYEVIEQDGVPTMVMEYLEGQPLSSILAAEPHDFPLSLRLHVVSKVLVGLQAAHELKAYDGSPLNLVHRDVSPHNVFVLYDGQIKVLDFGIAKASDSRLSTQTGILKGKIRYMPPEQLAGEEQDRRADLFAVGILLWEALTRQPLWGEASEGDIMLRLLKGQIPELPADLNVPEALRRLCRRALSGHRDGRPASAAEFLTDLEACLDAQNLRATPEALGAFVSTKFARAKQAANQIVSEAVVAAQRASDRPAVVPGDDSATSGLPAPRARATPWLKLGAVLLACSVAGALAFARFSKSLRTGYAAIPSAASVVQTCGAGTKTCASQCVSTDSPETGCFSPNCLPCSLANATPRCNAGGLCDIAICHRNFENCDGNSANGCEANLKTSPSNCGACGRRCPELPHAVAGCGDSCTIWRCEAGFRDCNGDSSDGCETAVSADMRNCGHCGNACKKGKMCAEGQCSQ